MGDTSMQARRPLILIVEDDRDLCALLQRVLRQAGYRVKTAADGAVGLARIARGGLDLVLLDLRLPKLDGWELCRQVRARRDSVCLPIIILTGATDEAERRAGFAAGANDYLTKPIHRAELLDRVQVWLNKRLPFKAVY